MLADTQVSSSLLLTFRSPTFAPHRSTRRLLVVEPYEKFFTRLTETRSYFFGGGGGLRGDVRANAGQ